MNNEKKERLTAFSCCCTFPASTERTWRTVFLERASNLLKLDFCKYITVILSESRYYESGSYKKEGKNKENTEKRFRSISSSIGAGKLYLFRNLYYSQNNMQGEMFVD